MKVKVTKEMVVIAEYCCINEGEVGVNTCHFDLPECFDGLTVTAAFNNIPVPVSDNRCTIPTLRKGTVTLGVYAYLQDGDAVTLMYSPKPTLFYVNPGSYCDEIGVEDTPSITEFEQHCNTLLAEVQKVSEGSEQTSNKVTEITEDSTDEQYPTAKAVYDLFENAAASGGNSGNGVSAAQKQTLLAVINAIGLFNTENAQKLLDDFNKAWDTVDPVPATSIALDKTELTFTSEDTQTIVASVLPLNTTDVVVWTSADTSVATVKNGVVTPLNDGETVITATAGNVCVTCAVTVNMFGEIENPVFMSMGKIDLTSTATSDPFTDDNYPQTVTFSAVPVKKGTILTFKTNIYAPQNWVRFYNYDTDGLNVKQIWFGDTENIMTTATQDGFIRVVFMRQADPVIIENDIVEFSTTTDGVKTTYTVVDRR